MSDQLAFGDDATEVRVHRMGPMPTGEQIDGAAPLVLWRAWLDERLDAGGARCPCCGQHAEIHRRSLGSTHIEALALLYRAGADSGYVHAQTVFKRAGTGNKFGGDVGKLALWGLVVADDRRREDGGHAGMWRLTTLGCRFLMGEATVLKYAHTYNNVVIRRSGDPITVDDVDLRFDLRELRSR